MNNDENLNNQSNVNNSFENNENMENNIPLQEVTVETSVKEEPYVEPNTTIMDSPIMPEASSQFNTQTQQVETPSVPDVTPVPQEISGVPIDSTIAPDAGVATSSGFEDVNKKSKVGLIVGVVVVLLLVVAGYFGYKTFFATSPYENAINNAFKLLKNSDLDKPYKISTNIKVSSQMEGLEFLNNYSFDYDATIDTKNNTSLIAFNINEKNVTILDLIGYLKDDKVYLQSKKLTDKTYFVEGIDFGEMSNTEDISYLVDVFENALKSALKDEKSTKKDITLSLDGNSIKATENIYTIDKNNIDRVTKNAIDSILNDDKAIKTLASISGSKESEIKSYLENAKKESNSDFEEEIKISIYTRGFLNTFAGFALAENNVEMIKYVTDGDKVSLVISMDESNKLTMNGNNETVTLKLILNSEELATGKITSKGNETTMELTIPEYFTLSMNIKVEEDAKVTSIDTSNAINVNDMSEEDMTELQNKLMEILQNTEVYSILESFMPSDSETTYDYSDYNLEG